MCLCIRNAEMTFITIQNAERNTVRMLVRILPVRQFTVCKLPNPQKRAITAPDFGLLKE